MTFYLELFIEILYKVKIQNEFVKNVGAIFPLIDFNGW